MKDTANEHTIQTFLNLLGHPVVLIAHKPLDAGDRRTEVVWPAEQSDIVDQACSLSTRYTSVYVNLNPVHPDLLTALPARGVSIQDAMIGRRTRVLLDIDGHAGDKAISKIQKDALKAKLGAPLIESDTGNGYALIYPCDLPNDANSRQIVSRVLRKLKQCFSCIDTGCVNAGRLTRLIGTPNKSRLDGSRIPTRLLNV